MRLSLRTGTTARAAARLAIIDALLEADPHKMLEKKLKFSGERLNVGRLAFDLSKFERVLVVGGGKASAYMAEELERLLNDRITTGVVNVPNYQRVPRLKRITLWPASHPLPDEDGERGARKMLELADGTGKRDFVFCLISGGGSALMPLPVHGVTLRDMQDVTDLLLRSGASIQEMNCVRKHLSAILGGRLAERFHLGVVLGLIVSDVVGNDLSSVASGPTVPDKTTYEDAKRVLSAYSLWSRVPASVRGVVLRGTQGAISETPEPGSTVFRRVRNVLVGSNKEARSAAARRLQAEGYATRLFPTELRGEAREVGRDLALLGKRLLKRTRGGPPVAVVAGGETTVAVKGNGVGGRNQELVLAAAVEIDGAKGLSMVSFATDGIDGNSNAAGAFADWLTASRARDLEMDAADYLKRNDSHKFFRKLGDCVVTGATGTNVNDIAIVIMEPSPERRRD